MLREFVGQENLISVVRNPSLGAADIIVGLPPLVIAGGLVIATIWVLVLGNIDGSQLSLPIPSFQVWWSEDGQQSGEEAQSERDQNVEDSEAKGIPKDRLGPSGKPKIHDARFPTRKAAKDAARQAGKGEPIPHSPPGGRPHFHPVDAAGRKIPGQHFEY